MRCLMLYFFLFCLYADSIASNVLKIDKNEYGDPIIVTSNGCTEEELRKVISSIHQSFFVDLPHDNSSLATFLRKQGFQFAEGDNEKVRWKKEIDVEFPHAFTCKSGTKVLLTKMVDNRLHALFTIEQKNGKPYVTWPGGMLKPGEDVRSTAIRECHEELGIEISRNRLRFLGVSHRKAKQKSGATMHEYLFHAPYNGQKIVPDGKEVLETIWVPVDEAIKGFVAGMPIREHKRRMLEAVLRGDFGRHCLQLPEFEQPEKILDPKSSHPESNDLRDFYPAVSTFDKEQDSNNVLVY